MVACETKSANRAKILLLLQGKGKWNDILE